MFMAPLIDQLLVTIIVPVNIDGENRYALAAPSGLVWRLTCPAANALEGWERTSSFEGKDKSN